MADSQLPALLLALVLAHATLPSAGAAPRGAAPAKLVGSGGAASLSEASLQAAAWNPFFSEASVTLRPPVSSSGAAPRPARYRAYRVKLETLRDRLDRAPAWGGARAGIDIALPLPDGRVEPFLAFESPLLGPAVRDAHPELRAYRAVG